MRVTLDLPAPTGGTTVDLAIASGGGSLSGASVVVAQDEMVSPDFTLTTPMTAGDVVIEASVGGGTAVSKTITVTELTGGLVINEIDYDQPDADTAEFLELFNGGGASIDLSGAYSLVLINGNGGSVYEEIDLGTSTLASGGFVVVHPSGNGVTVPGDALDITFDGAIQNGAPDVAVLVGPDGVVDYLTYEDSDGSFGSATVPGVGSVALPGFDLEDPGAGSLSRVTDGVDTDVVGDWQVTATPTPGAANGS